MNNIFTAIMSAFIKVVNATETIQLTTTPTATGEVLGATSTNTSLSSWIIWAIVIIGLGGIALLFFLFSKRGNK